MALSRKELRDGVKTILSALYPAFLVSTSRIEDVRNAKDAIIVTLETVDVDYQLNGDKTYEAQLNVRYMKQKGTDDELDTVALAIEAALNQQLPGLLGRRSAVLEVINYDDFEQATNSITLSYRITL